MASKNIYYHFASLKRLLTETDKKLLKELEDSLEKKRKNLKPPFGECFICQSELHWANNCPKLIKKNANMKMSHPQETKPKPDILKQAMNCIYDSNLQILLDEITDLKTRIESLERQIIQIIVIPLPCVKCQCSYC